MAPIDLIELDPARQLERDITDEDGRTPVTGPDTVVLQATDLTPSACPRCDTQHRELLGQPFSNAPLHRRAK
ncbi:MAG TPA: hypothetical protein VFG20_17000 [Planctomycetaceae bacterium]|jgi:hypothetical protein|nr:hypothetical protein [Planctomycetaceae bacterium]